MALSGVLSSVNANGIIIPCMADMELALRRASSAGMIDYQIGSSEFSISNEANLNEKQLEALNKMKEKLNFSRFNRSC